MWGGVYFASGPFAAGTLAAAATLQAVTALSVSSSASLTATARMSAASTIAFSTSARITIQVDLVADATHIRFSTTASLASPYGFTIEIGGVDATYRVRREAVQIRDVLNDAPNTASLTIEGDPPAVGQPIRLTLGAFPRPMFVGTLQTVNQRYDAMPEQRAWDLTAIDDTARANAKRPFGTWTEASASTVAQAITAGFTTLSPAGIALGLPVVTIVFDGSDTFIAALVRLANVIGGYTKVEDGTVYLFLEDTTDPPDPLDLAHPPLFKPPITISTDASQLRTRVYGKGYGEAIRSDVITGETLLPILDGVQFPSSGGEAIVGTTAEGAQSIRLRYTGVALGGAGTLVGPGAAPGVALSLALAAGAGVTSGAHTVSLVFVTANGKSLPGPPSSIDVGALAGPVTAPTASPPLAGLGPDEGTHDYLATFVTAYGETNSAASSNAMATSAIVSQLPPPAAASVSTPLVGAGADPGYHDYKVTFTNAYGETEGGTTSSPISTLNLAGLLPTPPAPLHWGEWGGLGVPDGIYQYKQTFINAYGETLPSPPSPDFLAAPLWDQGEIVAHFNQLHIGLAIGPAGTTGRRLYRQVWNGDAFSVPGLVATISNNTQNEYVDTLPTTGAPPPSTNTTGAIAQRIPVSGVPIGPGNTTGRRLYRRMWQSQSSPGSAPFKLVTTFANNSETTYTDATPNSALGVAPPTANTTGNIVQQIPLTTIPIGPLGVTARKVYRRFNLTGAFYLITTLNNNTATTYTDTVQNSARGAAYTGANTALGNQVNVFSIPSGPGGTTARELYMSPSGGGTRRLALTIADNTTTTATIATPDGSLGANEPVTDTSGLQQPVGQVNPGSTILPLAAATTFLASGGWAILSGGQVVRYQAISGQVLTGIPAAGPGAITTTVLYGQQALPSPMLLGVTGVTMPLLKGSAIHIWVQRDNLEAQAEQRARAGGDGVIEYVLVDTRRAQASLIRRCDAELDMFARPIVTVGYVTRDVKTRSGKPVIITLPGFTVPGSLVIQDVTITDFEKAPNLPPRYAVRASTVRFSLEDTLRRIISIENKGIR